MGAEQVREKPSDNEAEKTVKAARLCRCWFADGVLMCDTPEICYAEDDAE